MIEIPTPELVALVRRRYAAGDPVRAIVAETGIKLGTLYRCADGDFPDGSGVESAPLPRRHTGVRIRHRAGSRSALVARMWKTAERQVEEIEDRLRAAGLELAERESNARTLAMLAKTLRELSVVDEARKPRGKEAAKDDDDEAIPRNVEDLRQALARKLEAFVAGTADAVPDEPE